MNYAKIAFFILLYLLPSYVFSQNLKIDGAVIYVTEENSPILFFGGEIQKKYWAGCSDDNYNIPGGSKDIKIEHAKKNPKSPCTLIVEEGNVRNPNQHRFTVVYKEKGDYPYIYDLASEEKINKFIAQQETKKDNNEPDENKKDKKDKKGKKDKEDKEITDDKEAIATTASTSTKTETDNNTSKPDGELDEKIQAIDKEQLTKYVDQLVKAFLSFCNRIHNDKPNANTYIQRTIAEVFNNCDSCKVQTISKKSTVPETQSLRPYLNRIKNLSYKQVRYSAEDVLLVGNIYQNPDNGKYYANFSVLQKFTAYNSNDLGRKAYEDWTQKSTQIEIVVYEEVDNGQSKYKWKAFLTDIKAEDIKD